MKLKNDTLHSITVVHEARAVKNKNKIGALHIVWKLLGGWLKTMKNIGCSFKGENVKTDLELPPKLWKWLCS